MNGSVVRETDSGKKDSDGHFCKTKYSDGQAYKSIFSLQSNARN